MKRILTLTLAAALTLGAVSGAQAVDFKASGEWLMGFAAGDASLVGKEGGRRVDSNDTFGAGQRLRLQLDAVASEALSGTVFFEIGDQLWGNGESGAAMGADGYMVKVKNAYLDWIVPDTDLHIRMGQPVRSDLREVNFSAFRFQHRHIALRGDQIICRLRRSNF